MKISVNFVDAKNILNLTFENLLRLKLMKIKSK